jgi:hypothetical protein
MIMTMLGFLANVCADAVPPNVSGSANTTVPRYLLSVIAYPPFARLQRPVNGQTWGRVILPPPIKAVAPRSPPPDDCNAGVMMESGVMMEYGMPESAALSKIAHVQKYTLMIRRLL